MKKQTHHIQKQQVLLDFSTEEKARRWHQTAAAIYYSKVLPQLNSLFDKHIPEDRHYFVERLEIDLGTIQEEAFSQAFLKKIEAELIRLVASASAQKFSTITETTTGENAPPEEQLLMKESQEYLLESFYYFLDHGVLPWNTHWKNLAMLEADILQEIGVEKLTSYPGFQQRLHREFTRRRLYFQFSPSFWEEVCNYSFKPVLENLYTIQQDLVSILMLLAKDDASQKQLSQAISEDIRDWIGNTAPPDTQDWSQQYIRWMAAKASPHVIPVGETAMLKAVRQELMMRNKKQHEHTALITALKNLLSSVDTQQETKVVQQQEPDVDKSNQDKPASVESAKSDSPKEDRIRDSSETQEKRVSAEKPTLDEVQKLEEDTARDEFTAKDSNSQQAESLEDQAIEEEPLPEDFPMSLLKSEGEEDTQSDPFIELDVYYLTHAGIVLTWPYLARLFHHADYLEDNNFKSPRHQQRAVHLLAYVATGQEQCEEPVLVMHKFLCAWPLQMPVVKDLVLTDHEKTEADQMLSSLIKNWTILKNTSLEGLRTSFFDREGKLFKEEEQWRLIVEQKSYDMLLDHLPYTIAIIKLPWMKDILKVDWA